MHLTVFLGNLIWCGLLAWDVWRLEATANSPGPSPGPGPGTGPGTGPGPGLAAWPAWTGVSFLLLVAAITAKCFTEQVEIQI